MRCAMAYPWSGPEWSTRKISIGSAPEGVIALGVSGIGII
jgi:hypothetical protein